MSTFRFKYTREPESIDDMNIETVGEGQSVAMAAGDLIQKLERECPMDEFTLRDLLGLMADSVEAFANHDDNERRGRTIEGGSMFELSIEEVLS